ncbi:hypothetical protein BD310DRAFT_917547 [Dichomitus squalens]|uniref:Uncharacterized protein n=1 Tax=Dichomitus squalens TaxID=114155 RepID=A0A4Q9Q6L1_9APHY|nr:hypothetical protein BD310DRAFT_917547 [Dichomitus squalens]
MNGHRARCRHLASPSPTEDGPSLQSSGRMHAQKANISRNSARGAQRIEKRPEAGHSVRSRCPRGARCPHFLRPPRMLSGVADGPLPRNNSGSSAAGFGPLCHGPHSFGDSARPRQRPARSSTRHPAEYSVFNTQYECGAWRRLGCFLTQRQNTHTYSTGALCKHAPRRRWTVRPERIPDPIVAYPEPRANVFPRVISLEAPCSQCAHIQLTFEWGLPESSSSPPVIALARTLHLVRYASPLSAP